MNESEKQFSFTRAATSTSGRARKQFLISRFGAGLLLGTGLFVPGLPQNRATSRALPGRPPDASQPPLGVTPKLTESRQKFSVDTLGKVQQDGVAMNESEKQFSFTRAAPSTSGRAKKQIPAISCAHIIYTQRRCCPGRFRHQPSRCHELLTVGTVRVCEGPCRLGRRTSNQGCRLGKPKT